MNGYIIRKITNFLLKLLESIVKKLSSILGADMKKRFLIFISLLLSLTIFIFGGCGGEARVKYVGDESNYSTISGDFADSGLATELTDSINLVLSSDSLTRTDEGDFPQSEISKLNENRRSTVEIYSLTESGAGAGSGIFVGFTPSDSSDLSKGGIAYILTCFHVIDSAYGVNIRDLDGNVFSAGLIGADTEGDIALLWAKVDFAVTVAKLGNSSQTLVGETVYAIGNPTGTLGGTVTKGIISAKEREITVENKKMKLMQIDSAINQGNSGGGLYSADGYLIGMVNAGVTYKDGLGFAIPSESILESVNKLISTYQDEAYSSYGYISGRASMDVSLTQFNDNFYYKLNDTTETKSLSTAVLVSTLTDNGSFGKSGKIIAGKDVIKTIELGSDVYNPTNAQDTINYIKNHSEFKVGNVIKLTVLRIGSYTIDKELNAYVYLVEEISVEITLLQLIYCPPSVPQTKTQNAVTTANFIETSCEQENSLVVNTNLENYGDLSQVLEFKEYIGDFLGQKSVFNLAIVSLDRADDSNSCLTQNRKSVVELYSSTLNGGSAGSGVIIGFTRNEQSNGGICYVVTCHHCVENAYQINMKDIYGNIYAMGLIGSDKKTDVAVLWTKLDYTPSVAKFGDISSLAVLDEVYAIGNPTGTLGGTVTKGVVSSLNRSVVVDNRYMELIQIDSAINAGSSGGGLFTTDGYLVGIVNAGAEYKDGIGFAVPENIVFSVVKELLKTYKDGVYNTYGYVKGRVDFYSVTFSDVTNFFTGTYVSVTDIDENCSLYKAGLRTGDKITAVSNGEKGYFVESAGSLSVIFHSYNLKIGDTLTLKISRNGETKEIKAVLNQYIYKPVIKTNS